MWFPFFELTNGIGQGKKLIYYLKNIASIQNMLKSKNLKSSDLNQRNLI